MDFQGTVNVLATNGQATLVLDGDRGDLTVGGNGQIGKVVILSADGLSGMTLEPSLNGARLRIRDPQNHIAAELVAGLNAAVLSLGGGPGFDGNLIVKDVAGKTRIAISGRDGDIILRDDSGQQTVRLSGPLGDVILSGADAAEDFEIAEDDADAEVGSVMVIDDAGKLRRSHRPYDRRVAGVLAGAGDYKPGIVLGRSLASGVRRRPITLAGKAYCLADATARPIDVGDLLTSSAIPGHAMSACDSPAAFGAVIGKALQPLPDGQSLIPALVALQ